MRVLFCGGGTGGHISPALAMADIIKSNHPGSEIAFVGTKAGIESSLIPEAGYKLYFVNVRGIQRSLTPSNIKSLVLAIIKEFKPDIVIGTGGYACWPALKAAASMGVPTMLHESNALPGMAVRRLQNTVDVVMTNFESTRDLLSREANVVNVGNPLRSACNTLTKEEARKRLGIPDSVKFVVLSFGGSLGAEKLNRAAAEMMGNFAAKYDDIRCYHVGGKRQYENAKKWFTAYGLERDPRFVLMEYTGDLPLYMAAADAVVCRGGAMTVTEISKMGKAAVIIPSPNVADDHQYKNAKELADADAAIVFRESELTDTAMADAVNALINDPARRDAMGENIFKFATTDVRERIYFEISDLLNKGQKK